MPYDPHRVYQEAQDIVRYYFDLELTLIEAVKLRGYVHEVLNPLLSLDTDSFRKWLMSIDHVEPATEAVSRFFSREYGILPDTNMDNMLQGCKDPAFNAYMKRLQEQRHFP